MHTVNPAEILWAEAVLAQMKLFYLAWLYVALRAARSLVHLTYNKVFHRLTVYAASNVVLLMIWIRWFLAVYK